MREIGTAGVTGDRCRYSNFLQLWNRSASVAGAGDDEHEDGEVMKMRRTRMAGRRLISIMKTTLA